MKTTFLQMSSSLILGMLMGAMILEESNGVIEVAFYSMVLVCLVLFMFPPTFEPFTFEDDEEDAQ